MKPWKVILAILVIFAAGLVTGGLVVKKTQPPSPRPLSNTNVLQGPYFIQQHFLERMKGELKLTPQQFDHLEDIFAESRERIRILMDIIKPEWQAELSAVTEKVAAELSPEQLKKFQELLQKRRPPKPVTGSLGDERRGRSREAGLTNEPASRLRAPLGTGR